MASLVVGLVNSMPGEARRHTEQQFRTILSAAANGPVDLRLLTLDAVPPAEAAQSRYDDTALLEAAAPDGLIVTGMPPHAPALEDEPYWPKLTLLIDFAAEAGIPTVWSCLAAHAAVLYLDGIERRRLPKKLSGLIDCTQTGTDHSAMGGLPRRWRMPHSRCNGVAESDLLARDYRILSRSEAGPDIFAKDTGAPFLFCQGHPEYDALTLLREYRRDVRQFLAGERPDYPETPEGYFSPEVIVLLAAFRAYALRARSIACLADFPMEACAAAVDHAWRDVAVGLYANWLADVAERKARRAAFGAERAPAGFRRTGSGMLPALGPNM